MGGHSAGGHEGSSVVAAARAGTPGDSVGVAVRAAHAADYEAARALVGQAGLPTEGLDEQFESGYAVAVDASSQVVGVCGIEVHGGVHGLLRSAVVSPAVRGRGVGAALLADRLAWARRRGLEDVHLLTTTAAAYFARHGFKEIARAGVPSPVQAAREFAQLCPSTATVMVLPLGGNALRADVRARYGAAAVRAAAGEPASCCGPTPLENGLPAASCAAGPARASNPITSDLYDAVETSDLPVASVLASLGCGNPTALARLEPGQVVLDLGSGGGIDVLLSARRVGAMGYVYGLDMTDEMLALARSNQAKAGLDNVEFLKGEIEAIPLPADSVDVIISNCVINLSADKAQVLREAYRVLRPGGRLAISDVVVRGDMPAGIRSSLELWLGCVAGALSEAEYRTLLADAGFTDIDIEPTRVYDAEAAAALLADGGAGGGGDAGALGGRIMSAFVRATKPA